MATLVLGAIGTAIGGPFGGAIGAVLGQQIDQRLLAPKRKGPRLGDLSVQTSSYGTTIPRIYGTMRVAGTVVWATDLKEHRNTSGGGKGAPKSVTYSYTASFAVALSSRRAGVVKRIWADGKLLRGAAGDFKVKTGFRFHPGDEGQPVDPLVASVEGIAQTPAFRGQAVAVFEHLQLAEFGNRIPMLTFEVEADVVAPTLGAVLSDLSGGLIEVTLPGAVSGYAAHGREARDSIEPLIEAFGVQLNAHGATLTTSETATPVSIGGEQLGCHASSGPAARIERRSVPSNSLPALLAIRYYDPARDYQAGQAQASAGGAGRGHQQIDFAAVLDASSARTLAEAVLAKTWVERERLILRLPPSALGLAPGDLLTIEAAAQLWRIVHVTIEALVVVVELVGHSGLPQPTLTGQPGRSVSDPDRPRLPTRLLLLDLPDLGADRPAAPRLHLAAANAGGPWRAVPVEIAVNGTVTAASTAAAPTVMGTALTVLAPGGGSTLIDLASSVEIELTDTDAWLESRDDAALGEGANLAVVGNELLQFGTAIAMGAGRFRLERLLRGRRGTEWACAGHVAGEGFALVEDATLQAIDLPPTALGAEVIVRALGIVDTPASSVTGTVGGEALRPPSPVHLAAETGPAGALLIRWTRRSRDGWAWVDSIDAPLGESSERYRLAIETATGSLIRETSDPMLAIDAADLAALGGGDRLIRVRQIGDLGVSRDATINHSD